MSVLYNNDEMDQTARNTKVWKKNGLVLGIVYTTAKKKRPN